MDNSIFIRAIGNYKRMRKTIPSRTFALKNFLLFIECVGIIIFVNLTDTSETLTPTGVA